MSRSTIVEHDSLSPSYWNERWQKGDTQWHQQAVTPFLIRTLPTLDPIKALAPPTTRPRIFVPLCGGTLDMLYLIQQGWHVIGLDAVEQPIRQLIGEQSTSLTTVHDVPHPSSPIPVTQISADHLDLFVMDFFSPHLTATLIGGAVDAVWDRGSFVAIGVKQREAYLEQIVQLLRKDGGGEQPQWLVNAYDYNVDSGFQAPPHRLPMEVMEGLVKGHGKVKLIDRQSSLENRIKATPGLTSYDVLTYAITITH